MHVISRKSLRAFAAVHPEATPALNAWYKIARRRQWATWGEVTATFRTADRVGELTVFNLGGNKYRLVCLLLHRRGRCYVRHVFTHAEYDAWNRDRR